MCTPAATGQSTSVGTLLQILSEESTEVSRWLQHGDTVYAERLGGLEGDPVPDAAQPEGKAAEDAATAPTRQARSGSEVTVHPDPVAAVSSAAPVDVPTPAVVKPFERKWVQLAANLW